MNKTQRLNALVEKHCTTIQQFFAEFRALYDDRETGAPPGQEAMAILHKLKGSCGTIGFLDLHRAIAALEADLKAWPLDEAARLAYQSERSQDIEDIALRIGNISPEQSTLYGREF